MWLQYFLFFRRIAWSIRHIGKFSNAHGLARLLRSWSMTEPLSMRSWSWRQMWWQTVVAHPFEGSDRICGSNFHSTCRPTARAFVPPEAEFAFHLNVAVLSDSWRVWMSCRNSFSPLGVALSWCSLKTRLYYNMYINQQDAQNSCDHTLFSIRCSTCFGLY